MKYWFVLNGVATSGKGFFVDQVKKFVDVYYISSVDIIKDVCKQLGWNGEKDDKSREGLSELKKLSIKYFDHPFNYVKSELNKFMTKYSSNNFLFFVDVREPEEIDRLKKELGFKTILIKNNRVNHIPNNDADKYVENYNYDYIIENNGTEEDMKNCVVDFLYSLEA